MADEALLKKMSVKPSAGVKLLNAPEALVEKFRTISSETSATIQFVYSIADLERQLPIVLTSFPAHQLLWIAFPKKTSAIKTDISRDIGWDIVTTLGYRTVMLIAIDDDWSAFRIQPIGSYVAAPRRDPATPRPELIVPQALADLLANHPAASAAFDRLSYSHKKEYIVWIEDAKLPETRARRIDETIQRLTVAVAIP